ncbi:hypothetical protein AALO_G00065140, partial [Alosa alosa]
MALLFYVLISQLYFSVPLFFSTDDQALKCLLFNPLLCSSSPSCLPLQRLLSPPEEFRYRPAEVGWGSAVGRHGPEAWRWRLPADNDPGSAGHFVCAARVRRQACGRRWRWRWR